jgi:hypothetical protein
MIRDLYSKRPNLVLGFHGCDQSIVDKVIKCDDALEKSHNPWDWLGDGIYFWQNSKERAFEYAKESMNRSGSNIKVPAVVGAILDLGNCLDLLDYEHLQEVKRAYNFYAESNNFLKAKNVMLNSGITMLRYLDKAVMQMVHTLREDKYRELIQLEASVRTLRFLFEQYKPIDDVRLLLKGLNSIFDICNKDSFKDLIDNEQKDVFNKVLTSIQNKEKDASIVEDLDTIANYIRTTSFLFTPYDSVRSVFLEGDLLYDNAGFREKNHIQICIINTNCIKGFFIPKNLDYNYPNP